MTAQASTSANCATAHPVLEISTTQPRTTGASPHQTTTCSSHPETMPTPSNMAPVTSTAEVTCPIRIRSKLSLGPQASTPSARGNDTATSTMSELTPATQAGPSNVQCVIDPQLLTDTSTAPVNYRLERAKANSEKKRKPEGKAAPTAAKRRKTMAGNPAVPTNANSLRCVPQFRATLSNTSPQKHMHASLERTSTRRTRSPCRLRQTLQGVV